MDYRCLLLEAVKLARKVIKTKPLSDIIVKEFLPGDSISSDEDLINEIMYNHYLQYITTDNLYITGYLIDSKNVIYGV